MIVNTEYQIGGAELEAEALKKKILESENNVKPQGNTYYFSENGNDLNDGISPNSAFKSYQKISDLDLKTGDCVLFERGSVFRASDRIELVNGVSYGAYGVGDKPKIYGSLKDYAKPNYWCFYDNENIWETYLSHTPAGGITFNNESSFGACKQTKAELKENGDFYHDIKSGIFYLYYEGMNPGDAFENIEIATTMDFMRATNAEDITVDNLCFKYATFGPFVIHKSKNITISNCEMGWHGGKLFTVQERGPIYYGNAIEFWYRAENITVKNCWIYQVFDAAMTFQGSGDEEPRFININFEENLIEYCCMNIEYWADKKHGVPKISNISYRKNIIRFAGYGWGGIRRVDKEDQALLLGWNSVHDDITNFVITDNILDCADSYMIYVTSPKEQKGLDVFDNTYYQKKTSGTHNCIEIIKGKEYLPDGQENLEKAIHSFDNSPKKIKWLG